MVFHSGKGVYQVGFSDVDVDGRYKGPNEIFEDFHYWNSVVNTGSWSETDQAAPYRAQSVGTPTYIAAEDMEGGVLVLTTTNTSADEAALQLSGAPFFCVATTASQPRARQMRAKIRFKTSSITTAVQFFGLYVKDSVTATSSPVTAAALAAGTVGIGIVIENGVVKYHSKLSSATAPTAIGFGSIAVNTWYTMEIQMDAYNQFSFWVDGQKYLDKITTNVPLSTTAGLSPAFGIQTNTTAAITMHVDYYYVGVEGPRGRGLLHGAGGPQ